MGALKAFPFLFSLFSVLAHAGFNEKISAFADYKQDQTYTPTFQGFGTVSSATFIYSQLGKIINLQGRFTAGTTVSTEGRISLPSTCTTSSKYGTFQKVGDGNKATVLSQTIILLASPGKTYLNLSVANTISLSPLGIQNGNLILSTGETLSFDARIQCQ